MDIGHCISPPAIKSIYVHSLAKEGLFSCTQVSLFFPYLAFNILGEGEAREERQVQKGQFFMINHHNAD